MRTHVFMRMCEYAPLIVRYGPSQLSERIGSENDSESVAPAPFPEASNVALPIILNPRSDEVTLLPVY